MATRTHRTRPDTEHRRGEILRDAMAEMERRYTEPLTVEEVARAVGTSRRQLQRVFEEQGGTTFRHHLAAIRMRRAAERLGDGLTIAAVARSVGYSQPAQFAKAFRRHRGMSPSEARAQARNRDDLPI
jgi:AraC family transcriptional regulator of adaptative response / methylphosphotriester-DNA alkyltransferase methyltransferase